MEIYFGIHQELWQDAWIAATSAVKNRKRQIDLNVQQRVERLIKDHGPKTEKALTLRVYGTMIKGFSVINNDRARLLHSDCERLVLLFAAQPYSEGLKLPTAKLPAAKRQRVDAVTLDLDLARVKEAEQFDWTQAPLGEALLSIETERLPQPESSGWAMAVVPSLLEAGMLTEVFPEAPQAVSQAVPRTVSGTLPMEIELPPEEPLEAPHAAAPDAAVPDAAAPDAAAVASLRIRTLRKRARIPGHVIGFDVQMQLQMDAQDIEGRRMDLDAYAADLGEPEIDHLGPMQVMLPLNLFGRPFQQVGSHFFHDHDGQDLHEEELPELPEMQALLSRPETLGAIFAEPPDADAFVLAAQAAQAAEKEQAQQAQQAEIDMDLEHFETFDAQTAQVGLVIRRFVESETSAVTLDALIPPSYTEKVTAARTFASLLALASGGGLQVQQELPYGPISIALS